MRVDLRAELPQWVLIAAMFILAAVIWPSAPGSIPIHWGLSGQPDGYAGKFVGLLGLPLITLVLYLLLLFLPRIDPRRASYVQFEGAYKLIRLSVMVLLVSIYGFSLLWVGGVRLDAGSVVGILVGAFFIVLGNLMGKIRPNWFVGIRTPWTLSSKLSWIKTHRLGGWLFVLVGLAFFASGFVASGWAIAANIVVLVGCVLFLVTYSYLVWRSDPERTSPSRTRTTEGE